MAEEREFLSVAEVSRLLGCTVSRTYQLIAERRVPHVRRGRSVLVPRGALAKWIREQEATALAAVRESREERS